jgi:repressor of nif and glnA expression
MAEIYIIGDENDNYTEIETDAPIGVIACLAEQHLDKLIEYSGKKIVKELNLRGYHAATRDIRYLHLPGLIKDYSEKMDKAIYRSAEHGKDGEIRVKKN